MGWVFGIEQGATFQSTGKKDFSNGSNEKPNINHQKIRPTELHTESDCPDDKSREILQKIGAEIALLLLKEYKVIRKPVVITSKGVSILE